MKPIILEKSLREKRINLVLVSILSICLLSILAFFTNWLIFESAYVEVYPASSILFLSIFALLVISLILMAIYHMFAIYLERIIIDDIGIRYQSNLPVSFRVSLIDYPQDFFIEWNLIKEAHVRQYKIENNDANNPSVTLQIALYDPDTGSEVKEVFLCQWANVEQPSKDLCQIPNSQPWNIENNKENRQFLYQHPLLEALAQRDIPIYIEEKLDLSRTVLSSFNIYNV